MISVIVGTRPEIIKMAPVMRRLKDAGIQYEFIHTNQHYSKEMDADIIADLNLDQPDVNLGIGSLPQAAQTGRAMEALENYFLEERPDFVLVHGDTNTTLAGAVTAKKLNIPIGHVEAGLRSFDQRMPEEINRILVDRISDIHFAPTETAKQNLAHDGFTGNMVVVTGNTVVDALNDHVQLTQSSNVIAEFNIKPNQYILATTHRPENVDNKETLCEVVELLDYAAQKIGYPVIAPLHPRTQKNLEKFGVVVPDTILVKPPVGYIDMLALMNSASLIMTDSGGLQEEAYILQKPLVTMRDSTERPETLTANFIVKTDKKEFDNAWQAFQDSDVYWEDAFGKGDASEIIISEVQKFTDSYE